MSIVKILPINIKEASGICRSILHPGIYYVNNDSGNKTILYAINENAQVVAELRFSTGAADAEDCSSALVNGVPTLILCDVGDNDCKRKGHTIFVIEEPSILETQVVTPKKIIFSYPDNKCRNCEACSLNTDGTISVITKSFPPVSGPATRFEIKSWLSGNTETVVSPGIVLNRKYGTVTGMDNYQGTDLILGIQSGNATGYIVSEPPKNVKIQKTLQNEGICFSHDKTKIITVSERDRKMIFTPIK